MRDEFQDWSYAKILEEWMNVRQVSIKELSDLTGIRQLRLKAILTNKPVKYEERVRIESAMAKLTASGVCLATPLYVTEQKDILQALRRTLHHKLKKSLSVEQQTAVMKLNEAMIQEAMYYGLVLSRSGMEEEVLEKIRKRRSAEHEF